MAAHIQSGLATGNEGFVCFVCDAGVVGRYYTLATCRTQTTKVRLIEKLCQLLGDDYMVVISEEDVICRGCATMINSLDRLEKEVSSLRSIVLRYLEKKYEMGDGELVNARTNPPPSQPSFQPKTATKDPKQESSLSFQEKKRKFIDESQESLKEIIASEGKDAKWMQCNKCKFTTPTSNPGSSSTSTTITESHNEKTDSLPGTSQEKKVNGLETIVEERTTENNSIVSAVPEKPATTAEALAEPIQPSDVMKTMETEQFVTATLTDDVVSNQSVAFQAVDPEEVSNTICMVDENGMIVQKVEQGEDGTIYVQMADGSDPTKQVLSVAEDGSVQMVEVLWDDMVPTEDPSSAMVTF